VLRCSPLSVQQPCDSPYRLLIRLPAPAYHAPSVNSIAEDMRITEKSLEGSTAPRHCLRQQMPTSAVQLSRVHVYEVIMAGGPSAAYKAFATLSQPQCLRILRRFWQRCRRDAPCCFEICSMCVTREQFSLCAYDQKGAMTSP
jgi:hypothetical protein